MNAEELFQILLNAKNAGVNLTELEVIVPYSIYNGTGWIEGERYPTEVEFDNDELILK
jgi:hypothetical protein